VNAIRYGLRCGYCGVHETDVSAALTVDHFQPSSRAGPDTVDNWVYCCFACNNAKGDYWLPDSPRRILHPLRDPLGAHLVEQDNGRLRGLTETGVFHLEILRLNRPALVAHRLEKRRREREALRHTEIVQELADAYQELHDLRQRLEQQLRGE